MKNRTRRAALITIASIGAILNPTPSVAEDFAVSSTMQATVLLHKCTVTTQSRPSYELIHRPTVEVHYESSYENCTEWDKPYDTYKTFQRKPRSVCSARM